MKYTTKDKMQMTKHATATKFNKLQRCLNANVCIKWQNTLDTKVKKCYCDKMGIGKNANVTKY